MDEDILVHSEYSEDTQGGTIIYWSNYKIYRRSEWKLLSDLTDALKPYFGSEGEIEWSDIGNTIEIIDDKKRVEGFQAAFGKELSTSGYDIFEGIEERLRGIKERFSTDVKSIESYRSRITNLMTQIIKRSEEHTSELQSQSNLVCRLLL